MQIPVNRLFNNFCCRQSEDTSPRETPAADCLVEGFECEACCQFSRDAPSDDRPAKTSMTQSGSAIAVAVWTEVESATQNVSGNSVWTTRLIPVRGKVSQGGFLRVAQDR